MRNISAYPITDDEIIHVLEILANELASIGDGGDLRPAALRAAAARIREHLNEHLDAIARFHDEGGPVHHSHRE